jgi:hypothetical protein
MESELRKVLKNAVLSEQYGAGPVGGKKMSKKKLLMPRSSDTSDDRLVGLMRGVIKEELKAGFMKHPMNYGGCDHCCGSGAVGGADLPAPVCKKVCTRPQLYPYQAAQKALKGVKFKVPMRRKLELAELASMFNPELSVAKNAKLMREYLDDYVLPELSNLGMVKYSR